MVALEVSRCLLCTCVSKVIHMKASIKQWYSENQDTGTFIPLMIQFFHVS